MNDAARLVLLHTMDPRGIKLGGIETHVRLVLERRPHDVEILFVGIDETGDLALGKPASLDIGGRAITFLPVAHVPDRAINSAAKTIGESTTLRYARGLLRHLPILRRLTRGPKVSCEIERFEFALVPKMLGLPLVVLVHNEGTSKDEMDSLLKRYWFVHLLNERLALALADRVFAVNESIARRVSDLGFAAKTEVMSVSVDTQRFSPSPFAMDDDTFHVGFAGRLDAFKDPPLMFATLERLAARLASRHSRFRRLAFDYVGASDPSLIPGFAPIAELTVRHGIRRAPEVADLMRGMHAGIITSFFEGMPCYLLEMLASGRPVVAIRLPQFDPLIVADVSGRLVARESSSDASAESLCAAFLDLVDAIEAGGLSPATIAALAAPYSVEAQLHRLFACHAVLSAGRRRPPAARESARSA